MYIYYYCVCALPPFYDLPYAVLLASELTSSKQEGATCLVTRTLA